MTLFNENNMLEHLELSTQELTLLKSLNEFYSNINIFKLLLSIVNGENQISRRTIEYFVTNYSLYNKIFYNIEDKGIMIKFYVHTSYKDQLKAHKKKYFDPFGRGIRIPFFIDKYCIITTIGQLNFYKWFFSKKIYEYCIKNYDVIHRSLLNSKINNKKTHNITNYTNIKKKIIKYDYIPKINNPNKNIIVSFE